MNGKIEEKTMCFHVSFSRPGINRKANMEHVEADQANKRWLKVSKRIFDSPEYRAINRHVSAWKAHLAAKGLASPEMKGGYYRIPIERVELVVDDSQKKKVEFFSLVEDLVGAYPALKEKAKDELGPHQYREADYPTPEQLAASFNVTYEFVETKTPDELKAISPALFEMFKKEEKKKAQREYQGIVLMLREEFKGFIDGMVGMLGTSKNGKPKAFQTANVKKLREFLQEEEFRNVTDDAELHKMAGVAAALLDNTDPEILKSDAGYRAKLHESFGVVQDKLADMVEETGRVVSFEDV